MDFIPGFQWPCPRRHIDKAVGSDPLTHLSVMLPFCDVNGMSIVIGF